MIVVFFDSVDSCAQTAYRVELYLPRAIALRARTAGMLFDTIMHCNRVCNSLDASNLHFLDSVFILGKSVAGERRCDEYRAVIL